jgi:hypothetical protein
MRSPRRFSLLDATRLTGVFLCLLFVSIRRLHRIDFIMAAKTDALAAESGHGTRDEIREKRVP